MSRLTTDHRTIREWAEERGAQPVAVKGTGDGDDPGIIRLDFPGYGDDDSLETISWEEFFDKFEQGRLALVYQEETAAGERSTFNKFVKRGPEPAPTRAW